MKLWELKVGEKPCIPNQQIDKLVQNILWKVKETDKKLNITIKKNLKDEYEVKVEEKELWCGFEIGYMEEKELFDAGARAQAQEVYNWAASLENPTKLHAVKHPNPSENYTKFAKELYAGNFQKAKEELEKIIWTLWNTFPQINWPSDVEALWQLLMSINNIFARANNVIWRGTQNVDDSKINTYEIRWENFWNIIWRRAGQIKKTIEWNKYIDGWIKEAYAKCIDAMEAAKKWEDRYNEKQHAASSLMNTVWFNLWDKTNPENPLLGVEVYDKVMDAISLDWKDKFTKEVREQLHKHAMEKFIWNKALFDAIWKTVWKTHAEILSAFENAKFKLEWNTWELRLDFDDKSYIMLKADMKLGYYTQCVNHTVILDNISVSTPDGTTHFNSQAWGSDKVITTTMNLNQATTIYTPGLSFTVSRSGEKVEESYSTPTETWAWAVPTTNPLGDETTGDGAKNWGSGKWTSNRRTK